MDDPRPLPRIVVIEDDAVVAETLTLYLEHAGFSVIAAADGREGLALARQPGVALVILDLMIPGVSGHQVCRALRETSRVPILMLTARTSEDDRVAGLEMGADDYVPKPFSPREVVARVRAILKRSTPGAQPPGPANEFRVDHERLQIHFCNRLLKLTALEFRLLLQLVTAPGRVHSREQLLAGVGMPADVGYERNIDSHIKALRAKLREVAPEREPIQTHRGFGYSYQPSAPAGSQ
jgi:two-component system catabolic regulation response regulator CreB